MRYESEEPWVRASKQVVAGLFGRVAADYDQAGFLQAIARQLVRHARVRPGDRVLDVACGTGAAALEAARLAGPDGVVIGVDLAAPMAAEAARRLQTLGCANFGVVVMDADRAAGIGLRRPGRAEGAVTCLWGGHGRGAGRAPRRHLRRLASMVG